MDTDKFTRATERTIVVGHHVSKTEKGDLLHPHPSIFDENDPAYLSDGSAIWRAIITYKSGFEELKSVISYFLSEHEATEYLKKFPIGASFDSWKKLPKQSLREPDGSFRPNPSLFFSAGGDVPFDKVYECLEKAEVTSGTGRTSQKVLDWIGRESIASAKQEFSENWSVVVELEYCAHHFPRSSLAFMAAQLQYNYYISLDDYSVGYLVRRILDVLGGAEDLAVSALEARKSAGRAGGDSSSSKKTIRLTAFLQEIEALSDLVGRIGEKAILNQAFSNAIAADPVLWRQGRGQQEEYETILRSENGFMARYHAVFQKTA